MDQLKRLRAEKGLSQAKLAALADIDPSTVNQIERGAREASPATLRKLAQALDVSIAELLEDAVPRVSKVPAPPPLFNGDREEERRAEWGAAVRRARQLRARGRPRMEQMLSAWRDRRDRAALREVGLLLNDADAARNALREKVGAGLAMRDPRLENAPPGTQIPNPGWEEYIEADRFYGALIDMVFGAGLSIRREQEAHEVQNAL
jgi:transcriptional regulator with XRE-family HTH domain